LDRRDAEVCIDSELDGNLVSDPCEGGDRSCGEH
jgi:hypothetical protein